MAVYGRPALLVGGVPYLTEPGGLVKPDGTRHTQSLTRRGWVCSCPDFRFRGRVRPCKHLRALLT